MISWMNLFAYLIHVYRGGKLSYIKNEVLYVYYNVDTGKD